MCSYAASSIVATALRWTYFDMASTDLSLPSGLDMNPWKRRRFIYTQICELKEEVLARTESFNGHQGRYRPKDKLLASLQSL
jgi:hypothetical protein